MKCDKFIKYLKVKREVTSNGNENSESESGTVSVEESEDEVDPIFNIIDNEFDQINKNEDKEDNIDNSFIPVHPNNTNTNKNDKSKGIYIYIYIYILDFILFIYLFLFI